MSDLRIKRETSSVTRATDDDHWMNLRGTRDGSMITADWLTAMALEGRCFGINSGVDTTAVTHNAAFSATQQDIYLPVPLHTTIIPVYIQVNLEDTGTAAILDICAVASNAYDAARTDTDLTVYNMRMDAPYTSAISAVATVTSNGATPYAGNYVEFWRGAGGFAEDAYAASTTPVNELVTRCSWNVKDSLVPPVIVGQGSLSVFASGTTAIGFITVIWVEVPSTSIQ